MAENIKKARRCAIYTRKSSEEGLEQEFNSLHAQREACEAYIASQKSEGWSLVADPYDDGGYSGGTLDRPALRQLLADIEDGRVDVIVVYKIDRLSRSLMDFAKLVEVFDRKGVTFVSVTQSFNTTTSMGRLTLNILLSFAQFEREVTGERIRDKFAASKKKGMWMGGWIPIGYDLQDRALVVNEAEAETVQTIFRLYLDLGTVRRLHEALNARGLTTKRYVATTGRTMGGRPFSRGHLYKILGNPLYVGEVEHKGSRYRGQHPAIIERVTWDAVQAQLSGNTQGKRTRPNATETSLLAGVLFDANGNRLTPSHAVKGGRRYRYYVDAETDDEQTTIRISASEIEPVVIGQIVAFIGDASALVDRLDLHQLAPDLLAHGIDRARSLAGEFRGAAVPRQRETIMDLVERVALGASSIRVELKRLSLVTQLLGDEVASIFGGNEPVVLEAPIRIARRGVETKLVIDGSGTDARAPDPALLKAVARAYVWFEELTSGRAVSIKEIAEREGVTDRFVSTMLNLAFLAPSTVEAIVDGRQPTWISTKSLMFDKDNPLRWQEQTIAEPHIPSDA